MENRIKEVLTAFRTVDTFRTVCDTPPLEIREEDGKCGIVNSRGKLLVPYRYHNMYAVAPGQIVLCRYGKMGLLQILWDPALRRYQLRRTVMCEYDAVTAASDRIFVLRRGGQFAWYTVTDGSVSPQFRAVRLLGNRFLEGIGSPYEKEILCDLHTSRTYTSDTECSHVWAGRNAQEDILLCQTDAKCRLRFFDDCGGERQSPLFDSIAALCQQIPGEETAALMFLAEDGDTLCVLDDRGSPVGIAPESDLRVSLRSADRVVCTAGVGFTRWDQRPLDFSASSLPAEIARRALYGGASLPPMQKQFGSFPSRRRYRH